MARSSDAHPPLKPDIFEILLALEPGPLHGYGIIAAVEERTRSARTLLPSLLYRRLARLTEEGIVQVSSVEDPQDPRRKYYELTALGRDRVRNEAHRIVELGRALEGHRWSRT